MDKGDWTFEWIENEQGLRVVLPAPAVEQFTPGCAVAFFVASVLLTVPLLLVVFLQLQSPVPIGAALWTVYGLVVAASAALVLYAVYGLKRSSLPPRRREPSVLSVTGNTLKVERAEPDRSMDYSWQLSDIADVRIGAAGNDYQFLRHLSPIFGMMQKKGLIRFCVESHSGHIDDVMIDAPGSSWTFSLEERLRAWLGLANDTARG